MIYVEYKRLTESDVERGVFVWIFRYSRDS